MPSYPRKQKKGFSHGGPLQKGPGFSPGPVILTGALPSLQGGIFHFSAK